MLTFGDVNWRIVTNIYENISYSTSKEKIATSTNNTLEKKVLSINNAIEKSVCEASISYFSIAKNNNSSARIHNSSTVLDKF